MPEPGKQKHWTPEARQSQGCLWLSTPGLIFTLHSGFASIWEDRGSFGSWVWSSCSLGEAAAGAVPEVAPYRPGGTGSKAIFILNNLTEIHHSGTSW